MSTSGHTAFTQLPVVNISQLFSSELKERREAANALNIAARNAGFLYIEGHGIPKAVIKKLIDVTKNYFSLSRSEKMKSYIGLSQNHTGYVPQGEEVFDAETDHQADLKEGYDIGPNSGSLMQRFEADAQTIWPENGSFKEVVTEYYELMLELSRVVFRGFALGLDLPEDTFTRDLQSPPSQLRLLHYFENPAAKKNDVGIGAHTDYEFFTILLPTAPGLQVVNGSGEWIDVPVRDDSFVLNIGDMMELTTNGVYQATSHRVQQVREERFSFPFFASLDYGTKVKPLEQFSDATFNKRYQPVICGDHLLGKTIQTFSYLKQRRADGSIVVPDEFFSSTIFGAAK